MPRRLPAKPDDDGKTANEFPCGLFESETRVDCWHGEKRAREGGERTIVFVIHSCVVGPTTYLPTVGRDFTRAPAIDFCPGNALAKLTTVTT